MERPVEPTVTVREIACNTKTVAVRFPSDDAIELDFPTPWILASARAETLKENGVALSPASHVF